MGDSACFGFFLEAVCVCVFVCVCVCKHEFSAQLESGSYSLGGYFGTLGATYGFKLKPVRSGETILSILERSSLKPLEV